MNQPTTAIVILNWNTRALLEKFLPRVITNSRMPGIKIVVADNGSEDDSVKWTRSNYPEVEIIELRHNYGFAEGYNRALQLLDTEYAVLLNSDAAPGKDWLPPLIECTEHHPEAAACVPAIKDEQRPDYYEYAGAAGGFIDRWGYPFCRGRLFNTIEKDNGQFQDESTLFWGSGAALMVRREVFVNSQGLDPDFFAHMEEIDWCWRVKNQGYTIRFVPKSNVYHAGGGTLNYMNSRKTYLNFRNNLFLLLKNQPGKWVYPMLIIRMTMDFLALLNFLAKKEWQQAYAIHKAHLHFIVHFKKFYRKRIKLKPTIRCKNHTEQYSGSIVLDYFLKGKKRFTDLSWQTKS